MASEEIGTRVPDDWFVGFHRGLPARFWRAVGAPTADADTQMVLDLLDLPTGGGGSLLDAPCGDGRLAVRLAAAGHAVTGVDIVAEEVEQAQSMAAAHGVCVRFAVADMRSLPALGRFDAAVCWGNSFGYGTPADSALVLAGLRHALVAGGRLVLETGTAAESLLVGGVPATASYSAGGVRAATRNRYVAAEGRLETEFRFEDADGHVEQVRAAYSVHTAAEIVRMLRVAGFASVDLRGADGVSAYGLGERRLIAVATA